MWLLASGTGDELCVGRRRGIGLDLQAVALRDLHQQQSGSGKTVRGNVKTECCEFFPQLNADGCSWHWSTPVYCGLDPDLSD